MLLETVVQDIFQISPLYPDHIDIREQLAMIKVKDAKINPSPILFIHPPGGGKSFVRDARSILVCVVSLTIVPVLPLGDNILMKVNQKVAHTYGCIISIRIDKIKDITCPKTIIKSILMLPI